MNNPKQKTILLVEDDVATTMVETHQLKSFGYDVVAAKSGEEAVQIAIGNDKIALILIDVDLGPGIDGPEAARQILAKRKLPVVFLSSHTEKEYVERIKGIAGYGYVVKNSGNVVLHSSIEMAFNLFKTQEVLQASEERCRAILKTTMDGFWMTDMQGHLLDVNDAYCRMSGYSTQELLAMCVTDLDVGPAADDMAAQIQKVMEQGANRFKSKHRRKNGSIYDVEISIQYRPAEGGRLVSFLRDITEHKRAEEACARLATAIEQAAEIVMITDAQGLIQYVNPAFENVTGYTRTEALGQNPRILKSGQQDAAFYREMWETISSGKTWQGCFVNLKKKGVRYTEEATISPVRDTAGAIINYVAVKRDITMELNIQAQLNQAQKMESVGQLAGGVAHDFNNILQIIMGNAEMAANRMDPADPICSDLEEIKKAGRYAIDLTRQLLAFARKQAIAPRTLDLNETVGSMLKMLRSLIGENIELAWAPRAGLWPVRMDPSQMDQILANLCVNARDAIAGIGAVHIATENVRVDEFLAVRHEEFLPGDYVLLTVSDGNVPSVVKIV